MALIDSNSILGNISPPLDFTLCERLIEEFISMEKRFIQRDWEPTELDGGQFCEILSRILYHTDSGILNPSKDFNDCAKYIEDEKSMNSHALNPRHDAIHLIKVLRTVYKFRSQRGAVHISPNYRPNHMDSKLVVECVRWAMNETIRIFWQGNKEIAAKAIKELLRFDIPCIGIYDERILVQRTDLHPKEEILILLHYGGEKGFQRDSLIKNSHVNSQKLTFILNELSSSAVRMVIRKSDGSYVLTDVGNKFIRENLSNKLLLT